MKRGSGMKDREERSKGIEIRIADAFAIIKPTAPFKLANTRREGSKTCPIPLAIHYPKSMLHGENGETTNGEIHHTSVQ